MNIRGYFILLASTIWRTVVTQIKAAFRYRVAGGSDNSSLPERKGRAVIDTIYGTTVKWQQLNPLSGFAVWSSGMASVTWSVSGTTITGTYTSAGNTNFNKVLALIPNGHVIYVSFDVQATFGWTDCRVRCGRGGNTTTGSIYFSITANTETHVSETGVVNNSTDTTVTRLIFGGNEPTVAIGDTIAFTNFVVSDLTYIFGAGNEPTTAAFEAWLALNVGAQDYYPYDEGSLISFTGQGVKSVGFNQFDESTFINGKYRQPDGSEQPNATRRCSDIYFPCFPNTQYYKYHSIPALGSYAIVICWYDANKNFISGEYGINTITTSPANARYFRVSSAALAGNICVNLSDPAKNGTYEPYWEDEVDLSGAYINVWDEVWEVGSINATTGNNEGDNNAFRSTNYIKILPNTQYFFKAPFYSNIRSRFYDANKNYIGPTPKDGQYVNPNNSFVTPDNAYYIRFASPYGEGAVYKHNICINVSNADINGTYYPHALQSAGSVTDEDTATELTKKLGMVDLGTLLWRYAGGKFQCDNPEVLGMRSLPTGAALGYNLQCNKYTPSNATTWNTMTGDMEIGSSGNGALRLSDSQHSSSAIDPNTKHASFLEGIFLIYELATPITIPHDTPMQYAVDKYSTEEVIVPASADGSPTSTNIVADIEYQAK